MNTAKAETSRFILFVFFLAFLIRVIYIFQVLNFPLTEYLVRSDTFDQHGFDKRALFIASGNWLGGAGVFEKEPLYDYFLAIIYRVLGYNHLMAYLIQAFLTSIGVTLLYQALKELFSDKTARIAAVILALYSVSIFYDTLLLRASFITFLNILLFYLLVKAFRGGRDFAWFASGIVLGLSVITRHNVLLPFIVIFIFFTIRPLKTAFKKALILFIGAVVILLPVMIRNYIISDHKTAVISRDITAFWVGNVHDASGVDFEQSETYKEMARKTEGSMRKMAMFFLEEVKKNPGKYFKLYVRKIWMFFNGYEAPSNTNYYLYKEEFQTALRWPLFNFRFVCVFGLLGVILSFFRKKRPWLVYIFLVVLSLQVILFHIQSRFRLPVTPFFIMFCAYTINCVFDSTRKKQFIKTVVMVLTAVFLYVVISPDTSYGGFLKNNRKIRTIDRTNLALSYIDDYEKDKDPGSLKAALRQCDLVLAYDRRYPTTYRIKGYVYFQKKEYKASVREYKKAIIYDNRNPFLYNELAGVYFEVKDYNKAFILTKRALRLFPGNKVFERNLAIIPGVS